MHIKKKQKKREKKRNDMFVYSILLHWTLISPFEVYLLGIFVIVGSCEIFIWVFTPWAILVMHLESRGFVWEFYGILYFSGHGRYVLGMRDEWPFTRVSRSLSYPPFHHWWYFLYCTNMGWSSLIPLSHCFFLHPITSFQIFVLPFIHSLHIDTHYWFNTFFTSLTCFIDGLTTYPFFCFAINISFGYL